MEERILNTISKAIQEIEDERSEKKQTVIDFLTKEETGIIFKKKVRTKDEAEKLVNGGLWRDKFTGGLCSYMFVHHHDFENYRSLELTRLKSLHEIINMYNDYRLTVDDMVLIERFL